MKLSSLYKNDLSKLYESYGILMEGVQSIRPQYQMISDNDFNSLLKMDPTYSGGDNLGKYTKWILNLYKKFVKDRKEEEKYKKSLEYKKSHPDAIVNQPIYQSQDRIEDFQKIRDLLTDYEKYKKDIKQDISTFNSIAELASAIRASMDKDVSVDKQAMKNYKIFREAMADGLKVVYNGPNFIIGVPEAYEASSHFKSPVTDWCTAYPDMYKKYMDEYGGKYYIHLNKHTGELYQAHYESDQFKDASDEEIDKEDFIKKYPELKEFYDKIWNMNNGYWWILHNRKPSKEEKIIADIYDEPENIITIKNPTEEMKLAAVKRNGYILEYIENPSEEVQLAAVQKYGRAIEYIENPSEEIKLAAVQNDGTAIRFIKNPSEEIKLAAIKRSGYAIEFIENPTEEMKLAAVKQNGWAIQFIENPTEELKIVAVKDAGNTIRYIKNPSKNVQLAAVQNNGIAIKNIENPDEDVQITAVLQNKNALKYIKNPSMKVRHAASLA